MSILQVNLLGVPEVRHNGVVYAIRLRKAVALLAYLALAGRLRSREQLAALLWPEAGERESRAALRSTLSALRQSMGERDGAPAALQVISGAVGLDLNVLAVDVHELASAAALAQRDDDPPGVRAQLERAAAAYRGPLLASFSLSDAPEFETWTVAQRERCHHQMSVVLARLAALQQAAGELPAAIATIERWVAHDPLEEEAHRRLMAAHLAVGDVAAGLRRGAGRSRRGAQPRNPGAG
jgi:DNA-binding SARP family transcriptional activator